MHVCVCVRTFVSVNDSLKEPAIRANDLQEVIMLVILANMVFKIQIMVLTCKHIIITFWFRLLIILHGWQLWTIILILINRSINIKFITSSINLLASNLLYVIKYLSQFRSLSAFRMYSMRVWTSVSTLCSNRVCCLRFVPSTTNTAVTKGKQTSQNTDVNIRRYLNIYHRAYLRA